MPVALNCTQCGAALQVSDADVRVGVTTCNFCGTLLHLTEKGTAEYQDELRQRQPPQGVTIKRGEAGEFTIAAKITGGGEDTEVRSVGKTAFIIILIVTLAVGIGVFIFAQDTDSPLGWALGAAFVTFFAGLFVGSNGKPSVIIKDGIVTTELPMNWDHKETPLSDIKQLYTTTKQLGQLMTLHDIYALRNDGKRFRLYGSFAESDVALYIEEMLEIEMGIFNLPVFGETIDMPQSTSGVIIESLDPCANCGAELNLTSEAQRRGFITCQFCSTVTLLYAPDSEKPLLGLPDPNTSDMQFTVLEDGGVVTMQNARGDVLLTVQNGKVNGFADDTQFFMKQVTGEIRDVSIGGVLNSLRNLEERMAYSEKIEVGDHEDDQIRAMSGWLLGSHHFDIVAKTADTEQVIIAEIKDPREAALLLTHLK